jgi:hypothetical protein
MVLRSRADFCLACGNRDALLELETHRTRVIVRFVPVMSDEPVITCGTLQEYPSMADRLDAKAKLLDQVRTAVH